MAFTPTTVFTPCTTGTGKTNGDIMNCNQMRSVQLRTEEMLNHYFEDGGGTEYLAYMTANSDNSTTIMGFTSDIHQLQQEYLQAFGQFWILFQVLCLAMVIVFIGRWFNRIIS